MVNFFFFTSKKTSIKVLILITPPLLTSPNLIPASHCCPLQVSPSFLLLLVYSFIVLSKIKPNEHMLLFLPFLTQKQYIFIVLYLTFLN